MPYGTFDSDDRGKGIGRVDIISKAVAYMAGYNLRLLPIIQSMAQMDAVYGKELSRTIITNHALQIIYAPREQQDANDYSEMLGYTTVRRRARTRSHGQSYSVSDNEVLERRALMLPQELKAMGPEKEIVIYDGLAHPVLCKKIRYYKDGYFTKRLKPKVEVEPLELSGDKPMKAKTAVIVAASTLALLSACANPQERQDAGPQDSRPPSIDEIRAELDRARVASQNRDDNALDRAIRLANAHAASANPDNEALDQVMTEIRAELDRAIAVSANAAEEAHERALAEVDAQYVADRAANSNTSPRPPGPAAEFPPAPTVPSIPASQLRANLLRLLEGIQTLEAADRPLVEDIMGVKMGKPQGTDLRFAFYGDVDEGWDYGVSVNPRDDQPNSTLHFHLGPLRPSSDDPAQCTFDVDALLDDMRAAGWMIDETWYTQHPGRRYWGFGRDFPGRGIGVGGLLYFHFLGKNATSGKACVTGLKINASRLRGET